MGFNPDRLRSGLNLNDISKGGRSHAVVVIDGEVSEGVGGLSAHLVDLLSEHPVGLYGLLGDLLSCLFVLASLEDGFDCKA